MTTRRYVQKRRQSGLRDIDDEDFQLICCRIMAVQDLSGASGGSGTLQRSGGLRRGEARGCVVVGQKSGEL
jgi:hypothetical protein